MPRPERTSWIRDPLAGSLAGAGVIAIGVGVGFGLAARASANAAETAPTLDRYDELVDRTESRRTWAVVGTVAGSLLVAAGITRYVLVQRRSARLEPRARVVAKPATTPAAAIVVGPTGIAIRGVF